MDGVFKMIDIQLLDIDNNQPRKFVSLVELEELSISIKENGILQPIIVCKVNERYKIIVGERRFRAAKLIQLTNIPVIEVNMKESCRDLMPLVENIQRENFTPVEEAYAYKNVMNKYSLTQKDLSEKIGKSRAYISNLVRILDLEQEILNAVHRKEISFGHAKVILSLKDKQDRYNLYLIILKKKFSVRDAEKYVKNFYKSIAKKNKAEQDPFLSNIKEFLFDKIQTKIDIKGNQDKGKIEIEYFTASDLRRIVSFFGHIN